MSARLMSSKYPAAAGAYDPAMSFEQIGERLGITKQAAYFLFVSALKKLRRNREMLQLRELAALKQSGRPEDLV